MATQITCVDCGEEELHMVDGAITEGPVQFECPKCTAAMFVELTGGE